MTRIADFSGNGEGVLEERCVMANKLLVSVQGTNLFQYNSQERYQTAIVSYR